MEEGGGKKKLHKKEIKLKPVYFFFSNFKGLKMSHDFEDVINVVLLGAGGVGKTSLALQFVKCEFTETYVPTIEDEFEKNITVDGKCYKIEIVDTAGQEDFIDLRKRYIKEACCIIFMYAVDDESSLNFIQELYDFVLDVKKVLPPSLLIGNKCDLLPDLPPQSIVTKEHAEEISKQKWEGIEVIETSAKTNKNITEAIEQIVRKFKGLDKPSNKSDDKGGCCLLQ